MGPTRPSASGQIFGAARERHREFPVRQRQRFAVAAVHLRLKGQVRRQALARRRIQARGGVANDEPRHRRAPLLVFDPKRDVPCRRGGEHHGEVAAKADVLRALTDVKRQVGAQPARIATVDLDDAVLERQAGQPVGQRLFVEQRDVGPTLLDVARGNRLRRVRRSTRGQRHRPALGAGHAKRRGDAGLVDDLHQEHARAGLHQRRRRCPLGHFHAALGIDVDVHQRVAIEDRGCRLRRRHGRRCSPALRRAPVGRRQPAAARGTRAPSPRVAPAPQRVAAAPRRRDAARARASARAQGCETRRHEDEHSTVHLCVLVMSCTCPDGQACKPGASILLIANQIRQNPIRPGTPYGTCRCSAYAM